MTGPQDGGIWLLLRPSLAEIQDKKDFYKERSRPDLLKFTSSGHKY